MIVASNRANESGTTPMVERADREEENKLNILKICLFLLLFMGAALGIYARAVWNYTESQAVRAISYASILTVLGSLLGIVGSFETIWGFKHAEGRAIGTRLLLTSFLFLLVVFQLYWIFGTRALFYTDRFSSYLEALYTNDPETWEAKYSGKSLEEVTNLQIIMNSFAGYFCYLIEVFIVFVSYLLIVLSAKERLLHYLVQIKSFVVFGMGCVITVLTSYALKYREDMQLYDVINIALPISIITLGVVYLLLSVLGLVSAMSESPTLIKTYTASSVLVALITVVAVLGSVQMSQQYQEIMEDSCLEYLGLVHEKYMPFFGCEEKYTQTSASEDTLDCEIENTRYIWESNESEFKYGCLNDSCCFAFITSTKTKFDYLGLCLVSSVALLILVLFSQFFYYGYAQVRGKSEHHHSDKYFIFGLCAIVVASVAFIVWGLPASPGLTPETETKVIVDGATIIDARLLHSSYCLETSQLGSIDIPDQDMRALLSTSTGSFRCDSVTDREVELDGDSIKHLNHQLSSCVYCPSCESDIGEYLLRIWDTTSEQRLL